MKRRKNFILQFIFTSTLVVMLILAANVFLVSVVKLHARSNTSLKDYADSANTHVEITKANRGYIYDRSGNIIAQDNRTYNIICILDPSRPSVKGTVSHVDDAKYTAQVLSTILKTSEEYIYNFLIKDVYQTELGTAGRNLSRETMELIKSYKLPGIEFESSVKRSYPLGVFAPYLVGFAQSDETGSTIGKMGAEYYLDKYLRGTDGTRIYQADKNGYILPGMRENVTSAINGANVYLTLDKELQESLEQTFVLTNEQFNADRIWGAVMEVDTGKILSWGQYPSFDPNELDITDYNNYGAQLPFEPGSTFKTFAWAAAINEGAYEDRPLVYSGPYCYSAIDRNPYRVEKGGLGCINNAGRKNYGWQDYDYGLILSSNSITASLITELITPDIFLDYVKRFGFFQPVDTDGMREETGFLNYTWPSDKLALSYGQGSTVTMLQMLQAYSAVFSDGTMVKPYFIESIRYPYDENNIIYQAERTVVGNPITPETAKQLQDILYRVIYDEQGTAKYYKIPETEFIGKTGTTQLAVSGSYKSGKTIVSIIAGMPADDPKYMVYYCFEANYNKNAHFHTGPITSYLRKVAMRFNLTQSIQDEFDETTEEVVKKEIITYEMNNLINHSVEYAQNKLLEYDVDIIYLGEGNTVIDQYPKANSTVTTDQKVFLLLDTQGYYMPNMKGWSRKDVVGFWDVSGSGFKIDGFGLVTSQSIPADTYVNRYSEIEVVLE